MTEQQSAIVVGASSGIGRATAISLARNGFHVMAAARRGERLKQLRDELLAQNIDLKTCVADVSRLEDVGRLVEATLEAFERIDALVYATGTNLPKRSLEVLTPDGWQELLSTNLTGAYLCTQAVLPSMRSVEEGLIIYISSAAVQFPDVSGVAYQASKHGLVGLARGTRLEEKSRGIRTSVIYPGLCDTEILAKRPRPTPAEILAQALDPADVAEAVLFISRLPPRATVPELQILPSRL